MQKSKGTTPNRKKSLNTTATGGRTFKVDKEVTFNFVSKLKSPKPILANANNKSVLMEKNSNAAESKMTRKATRSKQTGAAPAATKDTRKSVQFSKTYRRKSALMAANADTKYVAYIIIRNRRFS